MYTLLILLVTYSNTRIHVKIENKTYIFIGLIIRIILSFYNGY